MSNINFQQKYLFDKELFRVNPQISKLSSSLEVLSLRAILSVLMMKVNVSVNFR